MNNYKEINTVPNARRPLSPTEALELKDRENTSWESDAAVRRIGRTGDGTGIYLCTRHAAYMIPGDPTASHTCEAMEYYGDEDLNDPDWGQDTGLDEPDFPEYLEWQDLPWGGDDNPLDYMDNLDFYGADDEAMGRYDYE